MPGVIERQAATIANGASLSDAVNLQNLVLCHLVMPAAWTAAVLTFQVSWDGTEWNTLYASDGTEYTVQAAASRRIILPPADFVGVRYIKVRSGTQAAPVNQGAARTIGLISKDI